MALARSVYNALMKRNSTYVTSIFAGSFLFSLSFDTLTSAWWENHNKKVPLSLPFFSVTHPLSSSEFLLCFLLPSFFPPPQKLWSTVRKNVRPPSRSQEAPSATFADYPSLFACVTIARVEVKHSHPSCTLSSACTYA
ncbi:uncharacterized protein VP01_470g4 [Puccinia sorghi]|uniref:Complex III subunit 9 n=1 Tax=Puccinia sorghi TaxID=27349 RepID=A0A0L6UN10_9BASI|nr:uncharacterized protein VP01_470g4 [Puccinia sorghi]